MNYRGLKNILCLLFAVVMTAALSACGSGGGGSDNVPAAKSVILSGVAATGAPVKGTVELKDSSDPAEIRTTDIKPNGTYKFVVNGLTPPFYIKVEGTKESGDAVVLYSVATKPGIANVNPISNVAVAAAAGVEDPALVYADPKTHSITEESLGNALAQLKEIVAPVLGAYNANSNPVTDPFAANHQGLDAFFDDVNCDIVGGNVMFTNGLGDDLTTENGEQIKVTALGTAPKLNPAPPIYFQVSGVGLTDFESLIITDVDEGTGAGTVEYRSNGSRLEIISTSITAVIANDGVVMVKGSGTVSFDSPDVDDILGCTFTAMVTPGMMGIKISNDAGMVVHEIGLQNIIHGYTINTYLGN